MIIRNHKTAFIVCMTLVVACFAFVAKADFQPVKHFRHGKQIVYQMNTSKIALFGPADIALVKQTLNRDGISIEQTNKHGNATILTLSGANSATLYARAARRMTANATALPGVTGIGPVYFDGPVEIISTGRIWVYLPKGTSQKQAAEKLKKLGLELVDYLDMVHAVAVGKPVGIFSVLEKTAELVSAKIDAEPELMRKIYPKLLPSDQYFNRQWCLRNTGENVKNAQVHSDIDSLKHADVRADEAWDYTTGSEDVLVGVIDSGTDCTHPELADKCVAPYNAIDGIDDASPPSGGAMDYGSGHGTSVAGIISAPIDGKGMVGVCPECKVVPVRLIDSGKYLTDFWVSRAFKHAVDNGAGIINNSWGPQATGGWVIPISSGEQEGQEYAATGRGGLGTLIVYASGNEALSTKWYGHLQLEVTNVMVVGATNHWDKRSVYSNFGERLDVCAPSNDMNQPPEVIATEIVGNGDLDKDYTAQFGGTSSAAPMVSGVAALVMSANPELTAEEVADILRTTADKIDADDGFWDENGHNVKYGYGRVNANKAVLAALEIADPACETPAAEDSCEEHLDENCDGYVDEGCKTESKLGEACASVDECGAEDFWKCPEEGKLRGACTWNCVTKPCDSGFICASGVCARECSVSLPCNEGFICTDDEFGHCLPKCYSDEDCDADEICDPESSLCKIDTDGKIGSPCESDECLGAGAFCLSEGMMGATGGYCVHSCMADNDCDGIGKCMQTPYGSYCLFACSFDGDCRKGYICHQSGFPEGTCFVKCMADMFCSGSNPDYSQFKCDSITGRCIDADNPPLPGLDEKCDGECEGDLVCVTLSSGEKYCKVECDPTNKLCPDGSFCVVSPELIGYCTLDDPNPDDDDVDDDDTDDDDIDDDDADGDDDDNDAVGDDDDSGGDVGQLEDDDDGDKEDDSGCGCRVRR